MSQEHAQSRPVVLYLSFEESLLQLVSEFLHEEGYAVRETRTADETLGIVERESVPHIVLMDNYHANPEAQRLLKLLPSRPELRPRLRTVGMAAIRPAVQGNPDSHITLPFELDDLLNEIVRLSGEMRSGG